MWCVGVRKSWTCATWLRTSQTLSELRRVSTNLVSISIRIADASLLRSLRALRSAMETNLHRGLLLYRMRILGEFTRAPPQVSLILYESLQLYVVNYGNGYWACCAAFLQIYWKVCLWFQKLSWQLACPLNRADKASHCTSHSDSKNPLPVKYTDQK